jgi:hypothetical protein
MSDGARVVAGILCLLVLLSAAVPVWGQSTPQAGVGEVSISGSGVISTTETGNNSTYLWQDEPVNVSVTVADYPEAISYGVCLGYAQGGTTANQLDSCAPLRLSNGTNGTAEFANVTWPANVTGEAELVAEVRKRSTANNVTVLGRTTVPVTVLRKQGDFDGDGLTNAREVTNGFNVSNSDMDSDGLPDGAEVNKYGSNPQDPNSDSDGIRDGIEIQRGTNPTATDTDGDGLSDRFERTLGTDATNDWTPVVLAVVILVVLGVLVAAFVFARRRWRGRFGGSETVGGDTAATTDTEEREPPEPTTDFPTTEPAPEPLTDEDRVLALLREHGGRMKQSQIVAETEWSKAKVSRLLSTMNDEGTIDKLSVGRENIISLDGHRPEAARSPHEENASD